MTAPAPVRLSHDYGHMLSLNDRSIVIVFRVHIYLPPWGR